jgi:hypothetical protein
MLTLERDFTITGRARRSLNHPAAPVKCSSGRFTLAKPKWYTVIFDALSDAREVLDWLENSGRRRRELRILDDNRFEVRWCDPATA